MSQLIKICLSPYLIDYCYMLVALVNPYRRANTDMDLNLIFNGVQIKINIIIKINEINIQSN